jgi:hypothetical protein
MFGDQINPPNYGQAKQAKVKPTRKRKSAKSWRLFSEFVKINVWKHFLNILKSYLMDSFRVLTKF